MSIKESKAETALVTVAETIGSALGSLAATGDKARKAFQSAASTPRRMTRKTSLAIRRSGRKLARTENATRRTVRRSPVKRRK
jgi:hypothetical protein